MVITFVFNFLFILIRIINCYNICPPIELRSSLTVKSGLTKGTTNSLLLPSSSIATTTTTTSTSTVSPLSSSSSSSSKIVCDCTTETRESAPSWEILCYQEYSLTEPNDESSESTVDSETVQYSALPIAFIIKYVVSRYIEINCYDSSPEFQPAMFQGFGVNEIDSFRVINCSLPTVPFNLIFHRTSVGLNNKESVVNKNQPNRGNGNSQQGGGSDDIGSGSDPDVLTTGRNSKVKGIRSLELRRVTPIKIDVKQLKHLFHGLDRLEQLTLENYIISIPITPTSTNTGSAGGVNSERLTLGGFEERGRGASRIGRRFKRSFGSRLNISEKFDGDSKYFTNNDERKVTVNPNFGQSLSTSPVVLSSASSSSSLSPSSSSSSSSPPPSSGSIDFDLPAGLTVLPTMKPTISSSTIVTKVPLTVSETTITPGASSSSLTMTTTTKKPTTSPIQLSKLPVNSNHNNHDNNKQPKAKEFIEMNVNNHDNNHNISPDKRIESQPKDEIIHKSSTLSAFSPTSGLGSADTKPLSLPTTPSISLPYDSLKPEIGDLSADKSSLVPISGIGHQESQSSFQYRLSNPIDFSFGSYFPILKSLVLYNFLVTKSTDNAIILKTLLNNLNNLEQLDLRSNILTHIPENLFSGSGRKLKRLYLMRNSIESLHPFAFTNLKELEVLDLFSNKIQLLPDSLLKDTSKLKQLRIKGNNFITLPLNLFTSTPLLTSLDLSSNRELSLLPVDLLKGLHNLRDITINDCNLNKFTINPAKFFSYASNLEKIELKGNLLTNLTQIHLFSGNPKLTTLDVSNNRIKTIDAEIFNENSSNLVNLNFYNNDLSFIPDKLLYHLKNLRSLNIGNNNLHTINNNIFYTLSNLEVLDLSRNQLISVNPGESKIPFGLGTYLKKINLSHNNLTNFNREFNSIQWNLHLEIEEINLSSNKLIGQVKIPIFYSTKSKIILDLRDNQISTINMDAILINEKLFIEILDTNKAYADSTDSSEVKVFISGNPFNCDCNLFPLLKYTRSSTSAKYDSLVEKVSFDISSDNLKCSSPLTLAGKSFYELNTIDLTCPIVKTKVCPSSCNCWFRAQDERMIIDCQSKNLTLIPKETVNIDNFQNLSLPGIKSGTPIKAVTLKMQNNRIKDLQPLERLISMKSLSSLPLSPTTVSGSSSSSSSSSPSTASSTLSRKRFPTSPISFELYFDNNSIDRIPNSLVKLLKLATYPINEANHESTESDQGKDISDLPSSPSSSSSSSLSSPVSSFQSSSPPKAAIVSLISLRNNNIHSIPIEFLDELRELQTSVAINNQTISNTGTSSSSSSSSSTQSTNSDNGGNKNPLTTTTTTNNNNNAVDLHSSQLPKYLKLYLGNNPYNCTPEEMTTSGDKFFCQMREFKSWLTGNYRIIGDIADINCETVNYNSNSALINIPDSILCPQLATLDQTVLLTMTAICVSLALCLLLVSILYYRNKQTVLAFFYIHLNPIFVCLHFHEDDIDEDKIYDAFVSYSSADRDIVMQLIEKLEEPSTISNTSICYLQSQSGLPSIHEGNYDTIVPDVGPDIKTVDKSYISSSIYNDSDNGSRNYRSNNHSRSINNPTSGGGSGNYSEGDITINNSEPDDPTQYFKLCIHERDWLPGNLISWNIVNSVQNSRRTIIILSKDFIASIWFQVEFHTAYYQMLEDKIDRLIVIVRGELPPREEMDKELIFLLTTKTYLVWGEKWFWEKLRYALPHKSNRKRPNTINGITDGNNKSSRCLKKSHFSTNAINYLKSGKDGNSKSKSPSKSAMMKEYVDQAIANHFQLNSTSPTINGSPFKSPPSSNGKSSTATMSSSMTTNTTSSSSPSLQSITTPNYGSTSDPIDVNFSTTTFNRGEINTSGRGGKSRGGGGNDYSKQGHVNESFVIETET
ncbi:uncharacterized protein LOC128387182 [Panonychus citri]|uniref:uncharacterized protein LOC128387182 n=1 Tax=Panonychus citri TaxID=50023 RepID=UPI0023080098|nr:uncharacterized protein LOC128387182 [Panonychus citri]